ncbi:MAG: glycosyl hydrolase, partial [Planctomycetota bacterium]|nr:glycosyl hydrolase [Planctomycetota bacterium]
MNRRNFLGLFGAGVPAVLLPCTLGDSKASATGKKGRSSFACGWSNPPFEFSQAPFWFWNDALSEEEIVRQLDDFRAHGVYGFVIHPRAGLPRSIGWMSDRMIRFMRIAIEQAAKRDMWVVLYDEGMYPSGSSSGQVVAENPAFRTRGLFAVDIDAEGEPELTEGQNLVAVVKRKKNGHRVAVIDRAMRPGRSVIRGLHFVEDDPPRRDNHREVRENAPPGADILNPESVACFIRLVYQRYYDEFKGHFGKTIPAIFTDEPSILARGAERGAVPGTTGILEHVSSRLGYDFTPYLPALWYEDEPDADRYRLDYHRAIQTRLEETFYRPISRWCDRHGVA